MGKTRAAYPPEFRRQMVDLVRTAAASVRGSGLISPRNRGKSRV
jgi:hypothetical protein